MFVESARKSVDERLNEVPSAVKNLLTPSPLTIVDQAGRIIVIRGEPKRIVSIAPSITEILFSLSI